MVSTAIKITRGGCGIKYTDKNGVARHALKTPEDKPFLCEIEQAKRLVGLGVAEYVAEPDGDDDKKGGGHLDAEQLETMTIKELTKLAEDMGLDVKGCKKKDDFIAVIVAADVDPGEGVDLEAFTIEELQAMANEAGIDTSDCKEKADYIAVIKAAEDELPTLGAADPA